MGLNNADHLDNIDADNGIKYNKSRHTILKNH
jgi:hypothetical protein